VSTGLDFEALPPPAAAPPAATGALSAAPASGETRTQAFFDALGAEPYRYDFFQAMRRLEALFPTRPRIGAALRPADEPVRFAQEPSLAFAPATLSSFRGPDASTRYGRMEVRFFGLLGPNGPLPLHLTEYARERQMHAADRTFARFLDVFHHRYIAMFYRAWAQAQPTVSLDRPREDRFAGYVGSLVGLGSPGFANRDAVPDHAKLFYSGLLVRHVRNSDGLAALLSGYFRIPVRIEQFVGHWLTLPVDDRTHLGTAATAALGRGAMLGARVWDRQHKFRLRLGPLDLAQYESFLPGGAAIDRIVAWVRQYCGFELDWDARLALAGNAVPKTRLGQYGRLGWTTWLGRKTARTADADDLRLAPEALCHSKRLTLACRGRPGVVINTLNGQIP
jgi:type VI secretion system protein ImpH